jgi:hypothetical protein
MIASVFVKTFKERRDRRVNVVAESGATSGIGPIEVLYNMTVNLHFYLISITFTDTLGGQ